MVEITSALYYILQLIDEEGGVNVNGIFINEQDATHVHEVLSAWKYSWNISSEVCNIRDVISRYYLHHQYKSGFVSNGIIEVIKVK